MRNLIRKPVEKCLLKLLTIMFFSMLFLSNAHAQNDTLFWFAAPEIDSTHADSSILRFASVNATVVTISIPSNPNFPPYTFAMAANSSARINLNDLNGINYKNYIENSAFDRAVNKGILIESTERVQAYYEVKTLPNAEVFALKGNNALGRVFYTSFQNYWHNKYPLLSNGDGVMNYGPRTGGYLDSLPVPWAADDYQDNVAINSWSAFDIVATEDGTTINITPTNPIVSNSNTVDRFGYITGGTYHAAGVTYQITLDRGQTYSARAVWKNPSRSIGGTKIEVTNPGVGNKIAVTVKEDGLIAWNSDNEPVYISETTPSINLYNYGNYAFDIIGDQLIPVELIGDEYIVMRGGVYPDKDLNPNNPPTNYDWDGERIFLTATVPGTIYTIKTYNNAGTLLNTITTGAMAAGQVYTYSFKYSTTQSNIEQFVHVQSNAGQKFYTYHVSGLYSELGSGIIPTVGVCTGSTQMAFTRSYNDLFQVNLMVKQGAEGNFQVWKGNQNVSGTFNIQASNFVTVPGTGWSVYKMPFNDWTSEALLDTTYIIKNTLNVFHLGILNISKLEIIDTTHIPQYIGHWHDNSYKEMKFFEGYPTNKTIPSTVIERAWNKTGWKKTIISTDPRDHIYYALTNIATDSSIYVAHWFANNRGAFYGYFSDFNEFEPFADMPDLNKAKCIGDTIQLKAGGGVSYTWNNPANLRFIDPLNSPNPRVIPIAAGPGQLTVQVIGFCSDNKTFVFDYNVLAPPTPVITGPAIICSGVGDQTYSLSNAYDLANYDITWTTTGGSIVTGQNSNTITVSWAGSGNKTVGVSVQHKEACGPGTATYPVIVSALPSVTPVTPVTVCSGLSVELQANPESGSTISWSAPVNGTLSATNIANPRYTATATSGTENFTVTVTKSSCVSTANVAVTINPLPTSAPTTPVSVCSGNTVTLNANPQSGTSVLWTAPPAAFGTISTTNLASTLFSAIGASGSQAITFEVTNTTTTCKSTGTVNVTIDPLPTATPTTPVSVCTGSTVTLQANPAGGATVSWSTPTLGTLSSTTSASPVFTGVSTAGGTETLTLTVSSSAGCKRTYPVQVTVNPLPVLSITPPTPNPICTNGGTINLVATPTGGTFSGPGVTGTTFNPATSNKGANTITYAYTDANGCSNTTTTLINVNDTTPLIFNTIPTVCCNTPAVALTQATPSGGTYTVATAGLITGTNILNPQSVCNSITVPTTYNIRYTYVNAAQCTSTRYQPVVINPKPTVEFAKPADVCLNAPPFIISGGSPNGGTYKIVTPPNGPGLSGTLFTPSVAGAGTKVIEYKYTNGFGCSDSVNQSMIVFGLPIVKAGPDQEVNYGTVANLHGSASGSPSPYTYSWTPTASISSGANLADAVTIGIRSSTTFVLSVTDNNNCKNTDTVVVDYTGGPLTVTIEANPSAVCKGNTVILTASANGGSGNGTYHYTWSSTNGETLPSTPTITVTPTASGIYTVSVTDEATPINSASNTANVTVYNLPTVNPQPITVCQGAPATLNGNAVKGTGDIVTYSWSGTTSVLKQTDINSPSVITTTPISNASVQYLVIDQYGCRATGNTTVTVWSKPEVPTQTITSCVGQTRTITAQPVGGNPATYTHNWSSNLAGAITTQTNLQTISVRSTSNGVVTLSYIVNDGNCGDTVNMYVQVHDNPFITNLNDSRICQNAPLSLNPTISGGLTGIWEVSQIINPSQQNQNLVNLITSNPGVYEVKIKATDEFGCYSLDSAEITIDKNPEAVVSSPQGLLCQGQTITLTGQQYLAGETYRWEGDPTIGTPTQRITTFTTNVTGDHSFMFIITDSRNCKDTADLVVHINENPTISLGADKEACAGIDLPITANPTGGTQPYIYEWSGDNYSAEAPLLNSIIYSQDVAGSYKLKLKVTDENGCYNSDSILIDIHANPVSNPTSPEVCAGEDVMLNGNPSGGSGSWASHVWSSTASMSALTANTTTATATPTFNSTTSGPHYFHYVVTDSEGCIGESDAIVTVNELPKPVISTQDTLRVCATHDLQLNVAGVPSTYAFSWSGSGSSSLSSTTIYNPVFNNNVSGNYTLIVSATDGKTCVGYDTIIVKVNALPVPVVADGSVCAYDTLVLQGDSRYAIHKWTGDVSPIPAVERNSQNPSFLTTIDGVYDLTYSVTDNNGCTDSVAFQVTVNPLPAVDAGADIPFAYGDVLTLNGSPSGSNYSYTWSPADSLVSNTVEDPTTIQLRSSFSFSLIVENTITHCVDSDRMRVIDTTGQPYVNIVPLPAVICAGDSALLELTVAGGKPPYRYSWTPQPEYVMADGSIRVSPLTTTTYTVVITDDNGITAEDSETITVNQLPVLSLPNQNVCSMDAIVLSATVQPQGTATIPSTGYRWTGETGPLNGNTSVLNPTFRTSNDEFKVYELTLTATDSKGCQNSAIKNVTVNVLPKIDIISDNTEICATTTANLTINQTDGAFINATTGYVWSSIPAGQLTSINGSSAVFTSNAAQGNITVNVTDANGCKGSDNIIIPVNANPSPANQTVEVCRNDGLTLNGQPGGGSGTYAIHVWSGDATILSKLSSTTIQTPTFNTSVYGNFDLRYTVTDSKGCVGSSNVKVVVNELPTATYSSLVVCQGEQLTITATPFSIDPISISRWIEPGKPLQGDGNVTILRPDTAGQKILYFRIETSKGCILHDTVSIRVKPTPTVTITPDQLEICAGRTDMIRAIPNSTSNPLSFSWSSTPNPAGLLTSYSNPLTSLKYDQAASFNLHVEYVDTNQCTASDDETIIVRPVPGLGLDPSIPFKACSGQLTTINVNPNGITNATFEFTGGSGIGFIVGGKNTSAPTFNAPTAGTYTLEYTITDTRYGCERLDTIEVMVNPTPEPESIVDDMCEGAGETPLHISLNYLPGHTYEWEGTTSSMRFISDATAQAQDFVFTDHGKFRYDITVRSDKGCSSYSTVEITSIAKPVIDLIPRDEANNGEQKMFRPTVTPVAGPFRYLWSSTPNVFDPASINDKDILTAKLTEDISATLVVTKDSLGHECVTTASTIVIVKAPLVIKITSPDTTVCPGVPVTLVAVATGGSKKPANYTWSFDGVSIITFIDTLTHVFEASTIVTVKASDGFLEASDDINVIIYNQPEVMITPNLNVYIIDEDGHKLTANVNNGQIPYTYEWTTTGGGIIAPNNQAVVTYMGIDEGLQHVDVKVTDFNGCSDSDRIKPYVIYAPEWPDFFCKGERYTFSISGGVPVKWVVTYNTTTNTYFGTMPTMSFDSAGVISIMIYDIGDPVNPIYSYSVLVGNRPHADFDYSPNTDINIDENVKFTNKTNDIHLDKKNGKDLAFYWDFIRDQVYVSENADPEYEYDQIGMYDVYLIAVDTISGCRDTAIKKLEVVVNQKCGLVFPNTFTPTLEDNKTFYAGYMKGIQEKDYTLKVFNRWGQLLWETHDKHDTWDGYFKGELSKQDTYVYQCEALCETGEVIHVNGDVTLMK